MISCYDCSHFSLRDKDGRAYMGSSSGMGKCAKDNGIGIYWMATIEHECKNFDRCENGAARREWVAKQGRVKTT